MQPTYSIAYWNTCWWCKNNNNILFTFQIDARRDSNLVSQSSETFYKSLFWMKLTCISEWRFAIAVTRCTVPKTASVIWASVLTLRTRFRGSFNLVLHYIMSNAMLNYQDSKRHHRTCSNMRGNNSVVQEAVFLILLSQDGND